MFIYSFVNIQQLKGITEYKKSVTEGSSEFH